jgi:hypothetical protein
MRRIVFLSVVILFVGCGKSVTPTPESKPATPEIATAPPPVPAPVATTAPLPQAAAPVIAPEPQPTPQPTPEPPKALPEPQPVAFDAGGLKVGAPLTDEWAYEHCPAKDKGKPDIVGRQVIDTPQGRVILMFQFDELKLAGVMLSFDTKCFDSLVESYTDKFGVPPHDRSTETVTTPIGAKYENQTVVWKTTNGDFSLSKYGSDIRHGFGLLNSPELAAYNERKKQASQGELKGKL